MLLSEMRASRRVETHLDVASRGGSVLVFSSKGRQKKRLGDGKGVGKASEGICQMGKKKWDMDAVNRELGTAPDCQKEHVGHSQIGKYGRDKGYGDKNIQEQRMNSGKRR